MSKYKRDFNRPLGGTKFLISIYNNQNSSWQGVLEWLDTGEKIHFRSALEMIRLMDEALDKRSDHHSLQRNWEHDGKTLNII